MDDQVAGLMPGAKRCVEAYAQVAGDERVLIITDRPRVARALARALDQQEGRTGAVECFYVGEPGDSLRPAEGLPPGLTRALEQASVVFNAFEASEEDFPFVQKVIESPKKFPEQKVLHMLGVTESMFKGHGALSLTDDEFGEMKSVTEKLAIALTVASTARIRARHGKTDLRIELDDPEHVATQSTGQVERGHWGNLPSGEAFVMPASAEGTIVIDRAVVGFEAPFQSFALHVDEGRVTVEAQPGHAGAALERSLRRHEQLAAKLGLPQDNVRHLSEFGIGTNPKAAAPHRLEQEKALGTIHVAVGDNSIFGGPIEAPNHIDMVADRPCVRLDDKCDILVDGELQREAIEAFPKINYAGMEIGDLSLSHVVRPLRERVVLRDGYLRRRWTDSRGTLLEANVGNQLTAGLARRLWESFGDGPQLPVGWLKTSFEQEMESEDETRRVLRLLRVMERFGVVELSSQGR